MVEDPALAIVIDPKMTMSAGKVEIGVFQQNQRLARERAQAIRDFILQNYNLDETKITATALSKKEGRNEVYFRFLGGN